MSLVSHKKSYLVCAELSNLRILRNIYLFSSSCLCPLLAVSVLCFEKKIGIGCVNIRKFDTYQIAFLMRNQGHKANLPILTMPSSNCAHFKSFCSRFCRLPGHLCPCFLLGKWNIHFIGRLSVSVSMALQRCWKPYNCNGVELFLKEYSDFDGNTGYVVLPKNESKESLISF